jgi:hypothetical protein
MKNILILDTETKPAAPKLFGRTKPRKAGKR